MPLPQLRRPLSAPRAWAFASFASCAAACAGTPRNPVLDRYPAGVEGRTSVTYYDVHGRTYAELHAEMRRLGPKVYGTSYVGETRSPMTWSWRTESTPGGTCTLREVRVGVHAEILLPRWTPPADADSGVVAEWTRFIAALETHEAGHKDISARAGRDLKDELRSLTGPCSQVSTQASNLARRIIGAAEEAQKEYDAETRHGLTQGTAFGAAPVGERRLQGDSAADRVAQLLVSPGSIELAVGDSLSSPALYRSLDVRGVTAEGDTLRRFTTTYIVAPNELLVRRGLFYVARGAGDVDLWVVVGAPPRIAVRESPRSVRVPIHIR